LVFQEKRKFEMNRFAYQGWKKKQIDRKLLDMKRPKQGKKKDKGK